MYRFMFELPVPATGSQLDSAGGDAREHDRRVRQALTLRAMREMRAAGVEPDAWKLEGTEDETAARAPAMARYGRFRRSGRTLR